MEDTYIYSGDKSLSPHEVNKHPINYLKLVYTCFMNIYLLLKAKLN